MNFFLAEEYKNSKRINEKNIFWRSEVSGNNGLYICYYSTRTTLSITNFEGKQ
jgi:hypothetical protein